MNSKSRGKDVILAYLGQDRNFLQGERKAEIGLKKVPKLGLLYLSAVLKKKGFTCRILDQEIQHISPASFVQTIKEHDPLFVGIYCATQLKATVIHFIQYMRQHIIKVPIVVGGPGYFSRENYLAAGADFICDGEGEVTISELSDYLLGADIPLSSIKGISYLRNKEVVDNPPRPLIEDLDTIPFPDWGAIDVSHYADLRIINMRRPFVTMITSRGCFGNCAFCSSPNMWGKPRFRTPNNTLLEIDYLVKRYGVKYIGFRDDVFGFNYSWVEEFCEKLKEKRYDLIWSCQTHPFVLRNRTEEKLRLLKVANCDLLILGLQKTNPSILKAIGRDPEEPGMVNDIVSKARKFGITTVVEFIFGLPGETEKSMKQDMRFSIKMRPNYVHFYHLLLIDGSRLHDEYFRKNKKVCDLSDMQIKKYIFKAMLNFYLNPIILLQNLSRLLRKPQFLPIGIRYVFNLVKNKIKLLFA